MKRFRIHYKSKAGDQYVTLLARNKQEAEVLANSYQQRRATRYDVTMQNLEEAQGHFSQMSKEQRKAEMERRKLDFSRYDIVSGDEVGTAAAPLKVESIKEVS